MLHKDMTIIIRNEYERQCFMQSANKLNLRGRQGSTPERLTRRIPVAIFLNQAVGDCMSYSICVNSYSEQPNTYEASDLFRNQLISMRRAKSDDMV